MQQCCVYTYFVSQVSFMSSYHLRSSMKVLILGIILLIGVNAHDKVQDNVEKEGSRTIRTRRTVSGYFAENRGKTQRKKLKIFAKFSKFQEIQITVYNNFDFLKGLK